MELSKLKQQWDRFGEIDPMWAILSKPDKLGGHWDENAFFATGRSEVVHVLERCGPLLRRTRALDFGCGIGRLTVALAPAFEEVVGVDIAPSMLREARGRHPEHSNVRWVLNSTSDLRVFADESFSFVYSSIVLQHVPKSVALAYLAEFTRIAEPGAMIVFQVPDARPHALRRRARNWLVERLAVLPEPIVRAIFRRHYVRASANVLARLPLEPMAMHGFSETLVRKEMARHGAPVVSVESADLEGGGWRSLRYYCAKCE